MPCTSSGPKLEQSLISQVPNGAYSVAGGGSSHWILSRSAKHTCLIFYKHKSWDQRELARVILNLNLMLKVSVLHHLPPVTFSVLRESGWHADLSLAHPEPEPYLWPQE